MKKLIQISRNGFRSFIGGAEMDRLGQKFLKIGYRRLPEFLEEKFRRDVHKSLQSQPFNRFKDKDGSESETHGGLEDAFVFLMNDPRFISFVRKFSGIRRLRAFRGRIYKLEPRFRDYMNWHDDYVDGRRVGITINLSTRPYTGGLLRVRQKGSKKGPTRLPNKSFGNAILFLLSRKVEHSVSPVRGANPKIAFAGWFNIREERLLNRHKSPLSIARVMKRGRAN